MNEQEESNDQPKTGSSRLRSLLPMPSTSDSSPKLEELNSKNRVSLLASKTNSEIVLHPS